MMPIENIQEFRSVCAWNFFFLRTVCMPAYKVAGPRSLWPDQGPSMKEFSMIQEFGKVQKLPVCHKLVKCYGN